MVPENGRGARKGAFFFAPASIVKRNHKPLTRSGQPFIMLKHSSLIMQRLLYPLVTITALAILAWWPVPQQDDMQAMQKCKATYPERYCATTYAPSTVAP